MLDPTVQPGMLCYLMQVESEKMRSEEILLKPKDQPVEFVAWHTFRLYSQNDLTASQEAPELLMFIGFADGDMEGMYFLAREKIYYVIDDNWFLIRPYNRDCHK